MSGDPTSTRHVFTDVTGCRVDIPEGRVTVDATDGPDATLDMRGMDGSVKPGDVVAERSPDGVLSIRLAASAPSGPRWLRVERRTRPVIQLRSPRTAWVTVETVGAEVRVSGCHGGLEATTVTGDATIERAEGTVDVRTVSGSITISGGSLQVRAATTSGRTRIESQALGALQVRSVSGRVDVTGGLMADRDHRIETLSGDVRITSSHDLRVDARTVSGRLVADGGARLGSGSGGSQLTIGDGSAVAYVTTVSGEVRLATGGRPPTGATSADPVLVALEALARGEITVEEADRRLEVLHG
jgi:hypothetical protein